MNTPRDRLIGARIEGRYRIDAVIARGGMSTVYMGLDCGSTGRSRSR